MFRIIGWGITCTSILLTQISQDLIILLTKVRMIMSFSSRIILTSGSGTLHLYLAHVRVAQLILCVYVPSRGPHLTVDTLCLCTNTGTASYCRYFVFMYQHGYRIVLLILCVCVPTRVPHRIVDTLCLCTNTRIASISHP